MKFRFVSSVMLVALLMAAPGVHAQTQNPVPKELDKNIRNTITKNPSMSGYKVQIEYVDSKIKIPNCPSDIEIEFPQKTRLWGRVNLQIKCNSGYKWTMTLPIRVQVFGDYLLAAKFIQAGAKLGQDDILISQGDLTEMPDDLLARPQDALGRQAIRPIQPRTPIFLNNLREMAVIKSGDPVRVQILGNGFEAEGSGLAQSSGAVNDQIRVKMPDGQQVQGRVLRQGVVTVKID